MSRKMTAVAFAAGIAVTASVSVLSGFAPSLQPDEGGAAGGAVAGAQPEEMPSMDEMMAMMAEMGAPDEHHAYLAKMTGEWNAVTNFIDPANPDEPMVSEGTMSCEMILGGRFLETKFHLPEFMGGSFEGRGINGYDKNKKQYVGIWIDSMVTHITSMVGGPSEDGSMVMSGTSVTPMGESPMKIVSTWKNENEAVDTFFEQLPDGNWMTTGSITYTRK